MSKKEVITDTKTLNSRESFRCNSYIKETFAEIMREKHGAGGSSYALRKYMEDVVNEANKQKKLF